MRNKRMAAQLPHFGVREGWTRKGAAIKIDAGHTKIFLSISKAKRAMRIGEGV